MDVPEWQVDGKPLRVHWQLLTVLERRQLNESSSNDVDALVAKARDGDGAPLFVTAIVLNAASITPTDSHCSSAINPGRSSNESNHTGRTPNSRYFADAALISSPLGSAPFRSCGHLSSA
jgi:hypothetical protein